MSAHSCLSGDLKPSGAINIAANTGADAVQGEMVPLRTKTPKKKYALGWNFFLFLSFLMS